MIQNICAESPFSLLEGTIEAPLMVGIGVKGAILPVNSLVKKERSGEAVWEGDRLVGRQAYPLSNFMFPTNLSISFSGRDFLTEQLPCDSLLRQGE
jgi:hypothetical protein